MGYTKVKSGYRIVARCRVNGKIRHRQRTLDCSKERAKSLHEQMKRELRQGRTPERCLTSFNTFGEALTFYTERHNTGKSTCYFNRLSDDLGNVSIVQLSDRFDKYLQLLKHSKVRVTENNPLGKPITNGTLNQYLLRARAALNFAVNHNRINKNPLKNFKLFKTIPRDKVLTDLEQQRLLGVIDIQAPHLSAIVRYSLQVPSRVSELVNMRTGDIDLINNCIRIKNGQSKNDTGCWKPIPPNMKGYFRNIPKESEYLFYRQNKKGYHSLGDFKRAWKRCLSDAEITGFQFRDTRHISASRLIDSGTPEQVVMQCANWKTNMLRTYYHRTGKDSLKLVRFNTHCEGVCEGVQRKAV